MRRCRGGGFAGSRGRFFSLGGTSLMMTTLLIDTVNFGFGRGLAFGARTTFGTAIFGIAAFGIADFGSAPFGNAAFGNAPFAMVELPPKVDDRASTSAMFT